MVTFIELFTIHAFMKLLKKLNLFTLVKKIEGKHFWTCVHLIIIFLKKYILVISLNYSKFHAIKWAGLLGFPKLCDGCGSNVQNHHPPHEEIGLKIFRTRSPNSNQTRDPKFPFMGPSLKSMALIHPILDGTRKGEKKKKNSEQKFPAKQTAIVSTVKYKFENI